MGLSEPVAAAVDEAVKLVESLVTRILSGELACTEMNRFSTRKGDFHGAEIMDQAAGERSKWNGQGNSLHVGRRGAGDFRCGTGALQFHGAPLPPQIGVGNFASAGACRISNDISVCVRCNGGSSLHFARGRTRPRHCRGAGDGSMLAGAQERTCAGEIFDRCNSASRFVVQGFATGCSRRSAIIPPLPYATTTGRYNSRPIRYADASVRFAVRTGTMDVVEEMKKRRSQKARTNDVRAGSGSQPLSDGDLREQAVNRSEAEQRAAGRRMSPAN